MTRLLVFLMFACWMLPAARAQSTRRPALHWSRGADAGLCIDPRSLALRVMALTGPVLVDASQADVSIEGHIEKLKDGSFEARLTSTDADGVPRGARTLRQPRGDCRALDEALAFVVALLIDPDLALERLPASLLALGAEGPAADEVLLRELEQTPSRPYVLVAKPPALKSPTAAPARVPARTPRWEIAAGPALGVRELSGLSLGAWGGVSALVTPWLALSLQLRAMSKLRTLSPGDAELRISSFSGALLACPRYAPSQSWFVEACGGAEAAMLRGKAKGFDRRNEAAYLAGYAALLGAGAGLRVGEAWLLRLRGQARILLNEPRFTYVAGDLPQVAFTPRRFGFGVDLAVGYRF